MSGPSHPGPVIQHDARNHRFTIRTPDGDAYLAYRESGPSTLDFRRTYVPPAQRHHALGRHLVRHALGYARARGVRVIPSCGFVGWVAERHAEDRALLVERLPDR